MLGIVGMQRMSILVSLSLKCLWTASTPKEYGTAKAGEISMASKKIKGRQTAGGQFHGIFFWNNAHSRKFVQITDYSAVGPASANPSIFSWSVQNCQVAGSRPGKLCGRSR